MPHKFTFAALGILLSVASYAQKADNELVYLKQSPPGLTPEVFAPGVISLEDEFEFGSVFSEDGTEFYYGVDVNGKSETRYTKLEEGKWTEPEKLFYHKQYGYNDPFLSPDEQKLYFISSQPLNGTGAKKDIDIWYAEKQANSWSDPINAGEIINSDSNEYYISFTESGTLYFASNIRATQRGDYDIYTSQQVDGQFQTPQRLSDAVNTANYEADVFVAYDESYLIFCSHRPGSYGRGDLYISFKQEDGSWAEAKNMGNIINTEHYEFCPFVTKDGKYFFYSSDRDIYWVSAQIIEQLRNSE
ncbi:TolB family protein [Tunicatimonas pelagia]|uniref:TolB family protein n=1 Tax=Tunicatimonas pelagia TaxID=931531 RepID=UPI0026664CE7|nr:hypothetical protein [Tunicatimonas pelagia]WKN41612.1 hypothetical protein P0M28_21485 [Tunicatimonas pelagia]